MKSERFFTWLLNHRRLALIAMTCLLMVAVHGARHAIDLNSGNVIGSTEVFVTRYF
jgi:hypothetical protein